MEELRIEDEEACELAAKLVELTGESLEVAVTTALREELERELERRARYDRIMAITRDIARSAGMGITARNELAE